MEHEFALFGIPEPAPELNGGPRKPASVDEDLAAEVYQRAVDSLNGISEREIDSSMKRR